MNVSLNAVCPYFTMYPLSFPLRVLARERDAKKWIFDPYCGRGATNFAARLLGMPSAGFDSSPVAAAIAQAKLANSSSRGVLASLPLRHSALGKADDDARENCIDTKIRRTSCLVRLHLWQELPIAIFQRGSCHPVANSDIKMQSGTK
jgi:hypothetical protein